MKVFCSPGTALACLALAAVPAVSAADLDGLLEDPEAAKSFAYCDWRFAGDGTAEEVPDFEAGEVRLRGAALADAGTRIALAATDRRSCTKIFASGLKSYTRSHDEALKKLRGAARLKTAKDPAIAEIQLAIADLWAEDQAARKVYIRSRTDDKTGAEFWAHRLAYSWATAADQASTAYLEALLERYDWIDAHRFGNPTASHAWILVQHADDHPELQQRVLSRMEPYLTDGGVRKPDYAHLWDRVAVNHGREQRYGTQPFWECENGKLALRPLEDPDNVDARRAEMGLGPVQDQLDTMSREVCGG